MCKKLFKAVLPFALSFTMVLSFSGLNVKAKETETARYAKEIAELQQGTTPQDVLQSAKELAKQKHVSTEAILKQFHQEITADKEQGNVIASKEGLSAMGGSSGTKNFRKAQKAIFITRTHTPLITTTGMSACIHPLIKLLNPCRETASARLLITAEKSKTIQSSRP